MQRIIIFILLLLPAGAYCQSSEIGFNFGFSSNGKINYTVPAYSSYQSRGGFSPYLSLKYLRNYGHLQFGAAVDYMLPHNSYRDVTTQTNYKAWTAKPLLPVYLVGNYKLNLSKNNMLYAGADLGAGITLTTGPGSISIPNNSFMPLIGAQIGYTHYFGRLGVNIELSEKYLFGTNAYNINSATVGVRWRMR